MADCNQSSYVLVQKMSIMEKVWWTRCSKLNIVADRSQYDIIIVSRMYIANRGIPKKYFFDCTWLGRKLDSAPSSSSLELVPTL